MEILNLKKNVSVYLLFCLLLILNIKSSAQSTILDKSILCDAESTFISINGYSGNIKNIIWQDSSLHNTWSLISAGAFYSDVTNDTMLLNSINNSLNGVSYRCIIDTSGIFLFNDTIGISTVTVYSPFLPGVIGGIDTVCYNNPTNLTSNIAQPSGGDGNYTYQWSVSTDGIAWSDIPGAISTSFQSLNLTSNTYYRLRYSSGSGCGSVFSNTVKIEVLLDITPAIISDDQFICFGGNSSKINIDVFPLGGSNLTNQWQKSIDGLLWSDINGETSNFISPGVLSNSSYFRLKTISDFSCDPVFSNSVFLKMYKDLNSGVLGSTQEICYMGSPSVLTFNTIPTGADGAYSYQWLSSTSNLIWNNIIGEKGMNYQPPKLADTMFYKVEVKSDFGCGNVITNSVSINVFDSLIGGLIGGIDTVCYNNPTNLTSNIAQPSGGDGNYTYQWSVSTDGIAWSDIPGAISTSFQSLNLTSNTYYRLRYSSGSGCGSVFSNTVKIEVLLDINPAIISDDQFICFGGNSSKINIDVFPLGGSNLTNQWQKSIDGLLWSDINGETSNFISPGVLSNSSYFRLKTISDFSCDPVFSNSVFLKMYEDLNSGVLGSTQEICYMGSPSVLTFNTIPTGADGDYSYQWQTSTNNLIWNNIIGEKGTIYQPPKLADTMFYKVEVTSDFGCGNVITNSVSIQVFDSLISGVIGDIDTICYNQIPKIINTLVSPIGGDGNYSYQWNKSSDGLNWFAITGATNSSYQESFLTSTVLYRLDYISGYNCGVVQSNIIEVFVLDPMVPSIISSNQSICYQTVADTLFIDFMPTGGGDVNYVNQWQKSSDGIVWIDLLGENKDFYEPGNLSASIYYRVNSISSYSCGPVYSNSIFIEVFEPLISGAIQRDTVICYNTSPSILDFHTNSTGANNDYSYQWHTSLDSLNWIDILGANKSFYQEGLLTDTAYYRLSTISNEGCGIDVSNVVKVAVYQDFKAGSIELFDTICYGSTPSLILDVIEPSGGDGNYSYNWYKSLNGFTWSIIPAASSKLFQPGLLIDTTYFKSVQTSGSGCGTGETNSKEVIVFPSVIPANAIGGQSICNNTIPGTLFRSSSASGGGNDGFAYQWQISADDLIWTNIFGETDSVYISNSLTSSKYFRLQTISVFGCGPKYSPSQLVNVYDKFVPGEITSNQVICYNTVPSDFLFNVLPSGADGDYSYQWLKSSDSLVWTDVVGAENSTFQEGKLIDTTYYAVEVTSRYGCGVDTTNYLGVIVYEDFNQGAIEALDVICYSDSADKISLVLNPSGGGDQYSYQWYRINTQGSDLLLSGQTTNSFEPNDHYKTTEYYLQVTSDFGCGILNTNNSLVHVDALPDSNEIFGVDTVCHLTSGVFFEAQLKNSAYSYDWSCDECTLQSSSDSTFLYTYWSGLTGDQNVSFQQKVDSTGCVNVITKQVFVRDEASPKVADILKKPNIDLLICSDSTSGIVYEWGFYDKVNEMTNWISNSNNQFVQLPHTFDTTRFSYFVKTFFEYPFGGGCSKTSYYNGAPYWQVSVEGINKELFKVYPNPFFNSISINATQEVDYIQLIDAFGNIIQQNQVEEEFLVFKIMTSPDLSNGIYFLVIYTRSGNKIVKKIIKC